MSKGLPEDVRAYVNQRFDEKAKESDLGPGWLSGYVQAMNDVSALHVAGALLRAHNLPHSAGTWKMLMEERLQPALDRKFLRRDDIKSMLQEMEEHGNQHVLLFQKKAVFSVAEVLRPQRVKAVLREKDLAHALDSTSDASAPARLKLVHVRFDSDALVFKAVEARDSVTEVDTIPLADGRQVRLEIRRRVRRVKLARLHQSGLLEVRLGSISSGAARHDYTREAEQFLTEFRWLVEPTHFSEVRLDTFKRKLWEARDPGIKFIDQRFASSAGNGVALRAKNRKTDVARDNACRKSTTAFLAEPGSLFDRSELLWEGQASAGREGPPPTPTADITVRIIGGPHEFYIRQQCTRADYEHVLADIRKYGGF